MTPAYILQSSPNGNIYFNIEADGYRLLTTREWEYCAFANNAFDFSGSNHHPDYCWSSHNSHFKLRPVGTKLPNTFDLYDMCGNAWEWTWPDRKDYLNIEDDVTTIKGGSYKSSPSLCKIIVKSDVHIKFKNEEIGFRICRSTKIKNKITNKRIIKDI